VTTVLAAGGVCRSGAPAPGWIAFADDVIVDAGTGPAPPGRTVVDLGDALLVPGFLDLQVNGTGDVDFATAGPDDWARARRRLLATGTTAFCPTFVSAPRAAYDSALARAQDARATPGGADVLGVHLEGPFLGDAPGAHPPELLAPADLGWLEHTLDRHPGLVTMVTLAPEADPGFAATRLLTRADVVVALGHSTASVDQARAAAAAGATVVTHLFNGMQAFHHREPGLVGAALTDERLTPTVIADGVHVHPAALRIAIAAKRSVALVTDSVASVDPTADAVRLADGTLAGSTLTLDRAVANVVALGVPVEHAVEMATAVPAAILGLENRGRLAPGCRADVVALDPASLAVRAVWLGGDSVTL
jgi:N-acetylglucosamine-6-phosphate deacetylase